MGLIMQGERVDGAMASLGVLEEIVNGELSGFLFNDIGFSWGIDLMRPNLIAVRVK